MKCIEGAGIEGGAEDSGSVFADVLGQIDRFCHDRELSPTAPPESEAGFWTDGNFVDDNDELVEVVNSIAVVFDLNR